VQDEIDAEFGSGGSTVVRRRGDVVLREARPWSRTVLDLLRHLEREGFSGAPRVVEPGFDDQGREMLSFVGGESPQPLAWSDEAAADVGAMLRDLHRATATFTPPAGAIWMPWWGRDLPAAQRTIGHCDAGPWNILARDGRPVALIDWDTAGPVGAIWDLAQAAWLNAQLHDDELAERVGLPTIDARARQLRSIADGYGLARDARASLVGQMIEVAVRSAAQESIDAGVTATGASPAAMGRLGGGPPTSGHDLLWAISWRTRSAAWMLRHRRLLERALLA
jgi:phosphotransferase family enzyme